MILRLVGAISDIFHGIVDLKESTDRKYFLFFLAKKGLSSQRQRDKRRRRIRRPFLPETDKVASVLTSFSVCVYLVYTYVGERGGEGKEKNSETPVWSELRRERGRKKGSEDVP